MCTLLGGGFAVLGGCGSEPAAEGVDTEIEEGIREKTQAFREAQRLISVGTPASISKGLDLISSAELDTTDRGMELLYLSRELYRIVYPYLSFPIDEVPQLTETNVYRRLFSSVREGNISSVPEGEATFLTTLISALTLLTAETSTVVEEVSPLTEQLLSINPDSHLARFLRAYALEWQGDYEEALERYRRVIAAAPSCYPARIGIVRILIRLGREDEAHDDVERLLERFNEEREVLLRAVEVFLQTGALERADTLLSEALSRYPEDSVLLRKRALLLEKTGRVEQARRITRVVENREGESSESLLVRVRLLREQGRSGQALLEAQRGVQEYPESTELRLELAHLLLERDRPADAREVLTELPEHYLENENVLLLLLDALIAEERWQDAQQRLTTLLERRDPDAELLDKGVRIYNALGNAQRALEFARRLVNEYPDRPETVERYVRQLLRMGRREEVREYISTRIEATDGNILESHLYYLLSEVQTSREAQIRSLQSALFENMQNEKALIKIARLYEEAGEQKKAARYIRQAISLNPKDEELRQWLRRLEQ